MNVPRIKIYGERNTGTNYLEKLVHINLEVNTLRGNLPKSVARWFVKVSKPLSGLNEWYFLNTNEFLKDAYFGIMSGQNLGWKHAALLPPHRLIQTRNASTTYFITLTKNPYSWLISLYKRPYHSRYHVQSVSFSDYLEHPWQTVRREQAERVFLNPVVMWNEKNRSYIAAGQSPQIRLLMLRYEDLLADPEDAIAQIQRFTNCRRRQQAFVNIDESLKREQEKGFSYYQDYYLNERWRSLLSDRDLAIINRHLDESVMTYFRYPYITPGSAEHQHTSL